MTIETMKWNADKVKSKDFAWFQEVVNGYVKNGVVEKPTEATVRKQWEKLTGKPIKTD